jgi:TonB family protein
MIQQLTLTIILLFSTYSAGSLQTNELQQRFDAALQAYSKGDYATAIAKFQELLQGSLATPYAVRARYYLGRAYYLADRYQEAIATYQQLKDGEVVGLLRHYELCKAYLATKEQAKAEEHYHWLKEEATLATRAQFNRNDPFVPPVGSLSQAQAQEWWQKHYRNLGSELTENLASSFWTEEETAKARAALRAANAPIEDVLEMGKNGVGRPTFTYKEKARYTEIARLNLVQGVVVLNVVLSAEGEVKNIRVLRGLADGLVEKAIAAAQKIRFNPATKDGVPVNVRAILEYSFNLY